MAKDKEASQFLKDWVEFKNVRQEALDTMHTDDIRKDILTFLKTFEESDFGALRKDTKLLDDLRRLYGEVSSRDVMKKFDEFYGNTEDNIRGLPKDKRRLKDIHEMLEQCSPEERLLLTPMRDTKVQSPYRASGPCWSMRSEHLLYNLQQRWHEVKGDEEKETPSYEMVVTGDEVVARRAFEPDTIIRIHGKDVEAKKMKIFTKEFFERAKEIGELQKPVAMQGELIFMKYILPHLNRNPNWSFDYKKDDSFTLTTFYFNKEDVGHVNFFKGYVYFTENIGPLKYRFKAVTFINLYRRLRKLRVPKRGRAILEFS